MWRISQLVAVQRYLSLFAPERKVQTVLILARGPAKDKNSATPLASCLLPVSCIDNRMLSTESLRAVLAAEPIMASPLGLMVVFG